MLSLVSKWCSNIYIDRYIAASIIRVLSAVKNVFFTNTDTLHYINYLFPKDDKMEAMLIQLVYDNMSELFELANKQDG